MKNPLRKRLPRELKSEAGKYVVIFLLMMLSISFISGFLVADNSMIAAYDGSFEKYDIEDGHFETAKALNRAQRKAVRALGITPYDLYFADLPLTNGSTLRIFAQRQEVDRVCLMQGSFPAQPGEIAIDRMYADNNGIQVGDTLQSGARTWRVTGLVALSDYSSLFAENSDSMFDSVKFGVSIVTAEEFSSLDSASLRYVYAWKYDDPPVGEREEHERSEDLMKALSKEVKLRGYVPRYVNQAIIFTGDDMGSDRAMMITLLYVIIVILAFVFAVTISNTILREAAVIGTLRASGYTRGELIRHYMSMPLAVTVVSAVLGNILGYTVMKNVCAAMYYGSYSLPTYVTLWNADAFLLTTVVPLLLMALITYLILRRRLSLSPLKFLRRDLTRRKQRRAVRLNKRLPFFSRFRLRVVFQNLSSYLVLFVGVLFANLMLLFGLLLPDLLDHYQEEVSHNMLSNYQYMLTIPLDALDEDRKLESTLAMLRFLDAVDTENEDAEKFSAFSLMTTDERYMIEELVLYGIEPDSRYVRFDGSGGAVWISAAFAEKNELQPGDTFRLKEKYEDKTYDFTVSGVYPYGASMCAFMVRAALNLLMEEDAAYFCGYFSETEITDIKDDYVGTVIDLNALTKISRQLDVSMGGMMELVDAFSVLMFLILIYLLAKLIIEKNAQAISMTKILGYSNREISRLYLLSTSIVVVLCLAASLPIETRVMYWLYRYFMVRSIPGWISFYVDRAIYVKMMLMGLAAYGIVAALEYRRICRIPMDEALKNAE
ncbi:MAG: FtsX-like permease family protein [Oscillospiraceae bacterium]|nr:FtsX-like permease family protein [Oscillospiraceae bacterium]